MFPAQDWSRLQFCQYQLMTVAHARGCSSATRYATRKALRAQRLACGCTRVHVVTRQCTGFTCSSVVFVLQGTTKLARNKYHAAKLSDLFFFRRDRALLKATDSQRREDLATIHRLLHATSTNNPVGRRLLSDAGCRSGCQYRLRVHPAWLLQHTRCATPRDVSRWLQLSSIKDCCHVCCVLSQLPALGSRHF